MTAPIVSQTMKQASRCPHAGLLIPECSCRQCCRAIVRFTAPQDAKPFPANAALLIDATRQADRCAS
jgi:hypothetical protein